MYYVDGFVLAVPTAKKEAYRALAEQAAAVFKRHGALTVVECWGDPMEDPEMEHDMAKMPFDGKRMIFGGFQAIVSR